MFKSWFSGWKAPSVPEPVKQPPAWGPNVQKALLKAQKQQAKKK